MSFKSIKFRLMHKSREQKYKYFLQFINSNIGTKSISTVCILDVGVNTIEHSPVDNYLEKNYPYIDKITALSITSEDGFTSNYPGVTFVQYDGGKFPFDDKQFDFVHSNAVIEHVGNIEKQSLFLQELIRVSRKGVFFTTPNKYFPFEMHTNVFLLHYLPKVWFDKFLGLIGKSWATGDYMRLLSKRDLQFLLQKIEVGGQINSNLLIKKERLMGFTYQLIGMITK